MARENKLPVLECSDKGFHTKIICEKDDKYICFNGSTNENVTISKELLQFVKPECVEEYIKTNQITAQ